MAKVGVGHRGESESQVRIALKRSEAASALSISVATLDRLTKAGEIRCVKHNALKIYPVEELARWMRSRIEEASDGRGRSCDVSTIKART